MPMKAEGKTVAILAADGFEESELFSPKEALEAAGARVEIISPEVGEIQGFKHMDKGRAITVSKAIKDAHADDYDAILIPGGLFSPDTLRTDHDALKFAASFVNQQKPVFAICHGPQVLISAGAVAGRHMTAVKAVRTDLKNAGAEISDEPVVVDHGLVTSRTPDDLPQFNAKIVEELCEGSHERHPKHFKVAFF